MEAKSMKAEITGAGRTVRYLPNEYRECADEDGVIRKYKVPVHEPSFRAGIKEVVEWVEQNRYQRTMKESLRVWNEEWPAKLKDWGIES